MPVTLKSLLSGWKFSPTTQKYIYQDSVSPNMTTTQPRLPPPEELAAWIRDQRYLHDLSQTELAEKVGISPSQLSRIENQSGRATYKTLYDIQQTLEEVSDPSTKPVSERIQVKNQEYGEEYSLAYVSPDTSIIRAGELMNDLDVSQLPVIAESGENVGRIAAQDLLSTTVEREEPVSDHMRRPFPEIPADAPESTARNHLRTNEAVLVRPGETDLQTHGTTGLVGLLTPADFTAMED